ncbi:small rab-related GTPase [Chloropicon primus]|uniref:Small rab-related GTPase n=1 Tax=Chloropicon primus TaxID=1764295 RepID=A0A5B8N2B8_9CHLO|nr:small rab-related GTPase [Chloropicon primus]UPR05211.1 small rab-related GTPase [Chloropicon primus]|eukprot:QDZ26010.1 small rab-related GTPase [Chloropicon primus]
MSSGQKARGGGGGFDHLFKILLVGDSGVGKSSILMRFTTEDCFEDMSPTIGVDFKLKMLDLDGKRLKLTIWDTAGQERFRTLTSSYYRGAQGIIFAYDVCRKETFRSLQELWMNEVDMYSTIPDAIKMVVGNKVDLQDRQVTKEEGKNFARQHGCLFIETSAKENIKIAQCFEELVRKMLETPQLVEDYNSASKGINLRQEREASEGGGCC